MKLSELIIDAVKQLQEHGDIPVVIPDSGCGCCKGYTYDPAEPVVEKEIEAYGTRYTKLEDVPVAYVVR
jgi:rubredoxin